MAVTLAQAKLLGGDAWYQFLIDEFAKSSWLLNNLQFEQCISTVGGGGSLSYTYDRLDTQPTSAFRRVNDEYGSHEVEVKKYTVDLKPFGGKYAIDRIIASMGGIMNEVKLQASQKIKGASALFNWCAINGNTANAGHEDEFDGLDAFVTDTDMEFKPDTIDLSTSDRVTQNTNTFLDYLDECIMEMDGTPSFIGGNTKLIAKIRAMARRASMYQTTKDNYGRQVEMYGDIPLVDFKSGCGTNDPVVPIDPTTGCTSLYMARLGLDGLHALAMSGLPLVRSWLPDYSTSGAVKYGEVEMMTALVLKRVKAGAIIRNLKVK